MSGGILPDTAHFKGVITKIALGTDGSEPSMRAAAWVVDLAKQRGAGIAMVHVFTTDPARLPGEYVTLPEHGAEGAAKTLSRALGRAVVCRMRAARSRS